MSIDIDHLKQWIGRRTEEVDTVTSRLADAYCATLTEQLAPVTSPHAPLALHWCLAPPSVPLQGLGPDGHPDKSSEASAFLPPVPLPRRMWAGGSIETLSLLHLGDVVTRRSTIEDVNVKAGRAGTLCFVTVLHEYATSRGLAIRDRQDIVYREAPAMAAAAAAPASDKPSPIPAAQVPSADLVWTLTPSPVLLFRYSALTFNSHRIHYDLPYAMQVEGYSGLVVHGPLQASILFNLAATMGGRTPSHFNYRGVAPLIAGETLQVCASKTADDSVRCWTQTTDGTVRMEASARWEVIGETLGPARSQQA